MNIQNLDFKSLIHKFDENERLKSKEAIDKLLFSDVLTKDEIVNLKKKFNEENLCKSLNKEFVERIFLKGAFLDGEITNKTKKKSLIIVFGNEARGISNFARKLSDYQIMIPHFGFSECSYNLSVSCGMILYHLYSVGVLPGVFSDYSTEEQLYLTSKMLINLNKNFSREHLKHYNIDIDEL